MAEPTMADFLQGRSQRPSPYTAPVSEFTTPGDMQRERISSAFGWDVGRPWQEFGRRAMTYLPMLPLGGGAVPSMNAPRVPQPRAASPEPGPWTPGHMEQWLSGRYQPDAQSAGMAAGSEMGGHQPAPQSVG